MAELGGGGGVGLVGVLAGRFGRFDGGGHAVADAGLGELLCGGVGASLFFALDMIEPRCVGHRGSRGEHANPGTMRGLSEVDRNSEASGENAEAGDVILVLVRNE